MENFFGIFRIFPLDSGCSGKIQKKEVMRSEFIGEFRQAIRQRDFSGISGWSCNGFFEDPELWELVGFFEDLELWDRVGFFEDLELWDRVGFFKDLKLWIYWAENTENCRSQGQEIILKNYNWYIHVTSGKVRKNPKKISIVDPQIGYSGVFL